MIVFGMKVVDVGNRLPEVIKATVHQTSYRGTQHHSLRIGIPRISRNGNMRGGEIISLVVEIDSHKHTPIPCPQVILGTQVELYLELMHRATGFWCQRSDLCTSPCHHTASAHE